MKLRVGELGRAGQCVLYFAACMAVPGAWAQTEALAPPAPRPADSSISIVREIHDPSTGKHWLVVRDDKNAGGPGRMVLAGDRGAERSGLGPRTKIPVIHAGDRLLVEEHTAAADAYLEGTATEPATVGSRLWIRLKVGGKIVRAMAIAPGRAALAPLPIPAGKVQP